MNDSQKPKIYIYDIRKMTVEELVKLNIETLRDLENQADKAVFSAGITLDWIRGAIAKKLEQQAPDNSASA